VDFVVTIAEGLTKFENSQDGRQYKSAAEVGQTKAETFAAAACAVRLSCEESLRMTASVVRDG
jgi:hypothetical protein